VLDILDDAGCASLALAVAQAGLDHLRLGSLLRAVGHVPGTRLPLEAVEACRAAIVNGPPATQRAAPSTYMQRRAHA
jgi:hypothetical protein